MKKTVLIAVTAFLLTAGLVLAQEHVVNVETKEHGDKKIVKIKHGGGEEIIVQELNLTDEQQKEFKKLDLEFEKATLALRNELGVKKLELEMALDEEKPNLGKINGLIDEIHKGEGDLAKQRVATQFKKRDLLTDEQKKNWTMHSPMHIQKQIIMHGDGPMEHKMLLHEGGMGVPHIIDEKIEVIKE